MEPAPQETPELPQEEPTLQDKVDYSREQLRQEPHSYHPDDNDLRLCCSSELHASLKAGMRGVGTWQGDRLLSFTPDDLQ